MSRLKKFTQVISEETHGMRQLMWHKEPHIGWWGDGDHMVVYHGTHEKNLAGIASGGIKRPTSGGTAGQVSMTPDPYTAHGYAAMHGGETTFRNAGQKAMTTPHHQRAIVVAHIPREWANQHMDKSMAGNMDRSKMLDRSKYDAHKAAGGSDAHYYQTSEVRFKQDIPKEFIKGYMKRPMNKPKGPGKGTGLKDTN